MLFIQICVIPVLALQICVWLDRLLPQCVDCGLLVLHSLWMLQLLPPSERSSSLRAEVMTGF